MKKSLLFTFSICCVLSATAQNNRFVQKLDSVHYGTAVERLQYDDRYNCTQLQLVFYSYGESLVYSTTKLDYDENNRVIKEEYDASESTGLHHIYVISYNEKGLVSERIHTEMYDNLLNRVHKYTYEYDENGNTLKDNSFSLNDNGEWVENYRRDFFYENALLVRMERYNSGSSTPDVIKTYTYNEQGLCLEITTTSGSSVQSKVTYTYDENDNCIEITTTNGSSVVVAKVMYTYDEWGNRTSEIKMTNEYGPLNYISKTESSFDMNGNCLNYAEYDYYDTNGSWILWISDEITYEPADDNIAGVEDYIKYSENWRGFRFNHNYKIVNYQETYESGNVDTTTFYYSSTTDLAENTESKMFIYPNPATELLSVNVEGLQQVEVYAMDGRRMMSLEKGFESINVCQLAKGCYLIKATMADGSAITKKFVKQ